MCLSDPAASLVGMRTSLLLPESLVRSSSRTLVEWARGAEEAGVDSIRVRGRLVHDSLEPLVALTLLAATTRHVELVLHLDVPHLARPRILERQLAGLRRASRGRLTVLRDTPQEPHLDELDDLELLLRVPALA